MADRDAIRERHYAYLDGIYGEFCKADEQPWPCDTAQLLAVVDGLRALDYPLGVALGSTDHPLLLRLRAALADTGTPVNG